MEKIIEKNKKQVINKEKIKESSHQREIIWAIRGAMSVLIVTVSVNLFLFLSAKTIKETETTLKIGFVTDFEYGYKNQIGAKLTNRAPEELEKVVSYYNNEFRPDLVVAGGDMVESSLAKKHTSVEQFERINGIFSKIDARREYALGNHDLRNFNKEEVRKMLQMKDNHTYFDYGDWRIIIMDTNFTGKGFDMGPSFYSGANVSLAEIDWLRQALSTDKPTIIFSHHPPFPQLRKNIINGDELRAVLEEYENLVLVVSGHDPDYKFNQVNGINYLIVDNLANIDFRSGKI